MAAHAKSLTTTLAGCAALVLTLMVPARAQEELNALVWCDHTDPALLEPFETAHNVRVNVRDYEGTGTGLSILEQSQPGDWDVFVVDGVDVPRVVEAGWLAPLPDRITTADHFPELILPERNTRDGQSYAITEKFGYNTISFDSSKIDAAELEDMAVLWSDRFQGRMAIYDYYLPVIGMVAMGLGKQTATLSAEDLPQIREALFAMKANATQIGEVVASQTALATGEVDLLVGGGEWVTAALKAEQPQLDWMVPRQGGVLWTQSIGVVAQSQRPELAAKFVEYIVSPEGQARLATSSCYWGMPANQMAAEHLTDAQRAALRWDDQLAYLERAQLYPAPDAALDQQLQALWTEFLQH